MLAEALADRRGSNPSHAVGVNEAAARGPAVLRDEPRHQPTVPRLFAPPFPAEMRTDTARKHNRPPPMWMVAAGSGLAALFAAGLVIAFASWSAKRGADDHPAPVAAQATQAAIRAPSTAGASGPFGSARNAFALALANPTQPIMPPPTVVIPSAEPTAPPAPAPPPAPMATSEAATPVAATPSPPPRATVAPSYAAPTPPRAARPYQPAPSPSPPPAPAAAANGGHGQISIICFPACEAVFDNGQPLGPSPIFKRTVAAGEHRLRMTSSNPSVAKTATVVVTNDQAVTVRQPMTP